MDSKLHIRPRTGISCVFFKCAFSGGLEKHPLAECSRRVFHKIASGIQITLQQSNGVLDGGSPCCLLILRNANVACLCGMSNREPTRSIVSIWVTNFQTEFMAEIYSESPVRAIGKVLLMKVS